MLSVHFIQVYVNLILALTYISITLFTVYVSFQAKKFSYSDLRMCILNQINNLTLWLPSPAIDLPVINTQAAKEKRQHFLTQTSNIHRNK
jgi:hypothetical protein